jgi:hypothetical protein
MFFIKSVDLTYSLAHGTYVVCLVYALVSKDHTSTGMVGTRDVR